MMPRYNSARVASAAVGSVAVTKKRYETKPAIVSLKMEAEFLRSIDEEVLYQSNQRGKLLTRSDVLKDLLREALAARAKKRSK